MLIGSYPSGLINYYSIERIIKYAEKQKKVPNYHGLFKWIQRADNKQLKGKLMTLLNLHQQTLVYFTFPSRKRLSKKKGSYSAGPELRAYQLRDRV